MCSHVPSSWKQKISHRVVSLTKFSLCEALQQKCIFKWLYEVHSVALLGLLSQNTKKDARQTADKRPWWSGHMLHSSRSASVHSQHWLRSFREIIRTFSMMSVNLCKVSSASSPQHFLDPCIFCRRTNSLEFTAWSFARSSNNLDGTWRRICSLDIRNVSALEVLRNRALQIDIYLLTYNGYSYCSTFKMPIWPRMKN